VGSGTIVCGNDDGRGCGVAIRTSVGSGARPDMGDGKTASYTSGRKSAATAGTFTPKRRSGATCKGKDDALPTMAMKATGARA
jgi:hypothetical protein